MQNTFTTEQLTGNQEKSLDNFLLNSSTYTQEEREVVMDAVFDYIESLNS